MHTDDNTLLKESKQFLRENWEKGADCPCCGQFVKKYRFGFNYSMARVLITMYHWHEANSYDEYVHVPTLLTSQRKPPMNNYTKASYWNLIEKKPEIRDDGSPRTGYWQLTDKGRQFVEKELAIHKYVSMYNNKILGFDGEAIDIEEALNNKFNYRELMNS